MTTSDNQKGLSRSRESLSKCFSYIEHVGILLNKDPCAREVPPLHLIDISIKNAQQTLQVRESEKKEKRGSCAQKSGYIKLQSKYAL